MRDPDGTTETIIRRMRKEINYRDGLAAVVSNLKKPRSDNNEGRCAQLLEDAIGEIERLESLLNVRDDFIVAHDLWFEFCDQLPLSADRTAFYSQ